MLSWNLTCHYHYHFTTTYNRRQTSWDTFCISWRFPIHTGQTPPLTPQTMLDACIQNVSEFQLCIGWVRMHCFMREPRMTEKYEYCITAPRTFVHVCSSQTLCSSCPLGTRLSPLVHQSPPTFIVCFRILRIFANVSNHNWLTLLWGSELFLVYPSCNSRLF